MGTIVEMVSLECGCRGCGKTWTDHSEMVKAKNIEWDMDYDEIIYFHDCEKEKKILRSCLNGK